MLGSISSVSTYASPTLSIMQSIIDEQNQAAADANSKKEDRQLPTVEVNPKPSKLQGQALENYYFGDHMTVNAALAKLMDGVIKELNGQAGADGKAVDLGQSDGTAKSYQQIATRIQLIVNMDELAADKTLMKKLESMLGVKLTGMTAADLVNAFADPEGKAARKVHDVVSEALAGQAGSKVMQRLDDATKGPRTVDEVKPEAVSKQPYDEIDDETKAEDQADIATAKVFETLGEVVNSGKVDEEETKPPAPETVAKKASASGDAADAAATDGASGGDGGAPTDANAVDGGKDTPADLPYGYGEHWILAGPTGASAGTSIYL